MIERIKAYIQHIKAWVLKEVVWGEQELKGKTGAEKKAIVVKRLDDLIILPVWLEWVDDMALPWLVDMTCNMLNDMYGHVWPEAAGHDTEAKAAMLPDPDVNVNGGDGQNAGAEEN